MKIIIVGAGFTGMRLARALTLSEDNAVTLIDKDTEVVRNASNHLDCAVMSADGNNLDTLEQAGLFSSDALVCVTSSDEVNMITCSLAKAACPKITTIARVRNYSYYTPAGCAGSPRLDGGSQTLGINYMINPDTEAAEAITSAVRHGAAGDVLDFEDSDYVLSSVCVAQDSPLCGKRLFEVRSLTRYPFLIAYIENMADTNERQVVLPSGGTRIAAGSVLGIVTRKEDTKEVFALCGMGTKELRNIAIVGAGRIGTIIAKKLLEGESETKNTGVKADTLKSGVVSWLNKILRSRTKEPSRNVVIIDSDERLAKAASTEFDKKARVFCADATDEAFLVEEGITSFDLAICATHNHEMNMVLAAYLENLGVGQSVSLVESSAFAVIARRLGVDVAVPLQDTIVDSIISHLRGSAVKGVHTVAAGDLEIIECIIGGESTVKDTTVKDTSARDTSVRGKSLKEIALPGVFLVMLFRPASSSVYEIPTGDTVLSEGDSCILIVKASESEKVVAMFGGEKQ